MRSSCKELKELKQIDRYIFVVDCWTSGDAVFPADYLAGGVSNSPNKVPKF